MQQQNIIRSERRSITPRAAGKIRSRNSARNSNATRSTAGAARSYRQTVARDEDNQQSDTRRSKKDNGRSSAKNSSARPLAKRRSPVGGGRNVSSKTRSPQASARWGKQTSSGNKGKTTPNTPRGSSAKGARSRR